MPDVPYTLSDPETPAMGLIVLSVDETIETEFRTSLPPDSARLYVSRVPSGETLTPDSIAEMETNLTAAAHLLPQAVNFDVIGYACTSGTAQIGADKVAHLVRQGATARAITNPLSAAIQKLISLQTKRVAIVSPYTADVSQPLESAFETAGLSVAGTLSFGEEIEARVARIAPASIAEAARKLHTRTQPDALFISCTNLRTQHILSDLERDLNIPVISSNQALAWHMQTLAQGEPSQVG